MRRLYILYFWVFVNKNNVSFIELLRFLTKPKIARIASRFRKRVVKNGQYEVAFYSLPHILYWPKSFSVNRLDQVMAETFDKDDWHYYQKAGTEVAPGEVILDIGTAEGLFPLTVIEKCAHVYMIEPSSLFAECLEKTFSNFSDKISIYNIAVGNEDGEIAFDEDSLEGMIKSDDGSNHVNRIPIKKIDTLFQQGERITYLKADIEGFELEMLKGASELIKRCKPKIAITTYHIPNDPNEIIALIKSYVPEYNYYVKGIYEKTPKPVLIHFWV